MLLIYDDTFDRLLKKINWNFPRVDPNFASNRTLRWNINRNKFSSWADNSFLRDTAGEKYENSLTRQLIRYDVRLCQCGNWQDCCQRFCRLLTTNLNLGLQNLYDRFNIAGDIFKKIHLLQGHLFFLILFLGNDDGYVTYMRIGYVHESHNIAISKEPYNWYNVTAIHNSRKVTTLACVVIFCD